MCRKSPNADTDASFASLREAVRALDPRATVDSVATMDQIASQSVAKQRLYAILLTLFAAIAIVLASIGVYGIVAFGVTQRTREIGIRIALGATHHDVMWLVLRQSVWLIGEGLLVGLLGAGGTTRQLGAWLFGIAPFDGTTFVATAALLGTVAATAAWLPVRRAIRVDPIVTLRTD